MASKKKNKLKNKKGNEVLLIKVDKDQNETVEVPEDGVKKVKLHEKLEPKEIEKILKDAQKSIKFKRPE